MPSTPRFEQFVHDEFCLVHSHTEMNEFGKGSNVSFLLTVLTSLTPLTLLMGVAFHSVNEANSVNKVNSIARESHIPNGYRYA